MRLSEFIVRKRFVFLVAAVVIAIACALLIPRTNINTDMTRYLPNDSQMKQGIDQMTVEFGENLENPMLWGEPQTAKESKAAITRYVKLSPSSVSIRRSIDTSESNTTSSFREDFGWMVISDSELPESILPAQNQKEKQPIRIEYYSLDGKLVRQPQNGLFIQRYIYSDGTSKAIKKKF